MGLDSLFERLVIATESIAKSLEARGKIDSDVLAERAAVDLPKRNKRSGGDKVKPDEQAAPESVATAPTPVAPAQKSFLDDEEEAAPAVPVFTEKERRDRIRKGLQQLQTKTNPENALKVLKDVGLVEILRDLKAEQFDAMDAAIAKALA